MPVTANFLKLGLDEGMGVYEYAVEYEPRVDNRDQRFRLVNQQREVLGGAKVFDGVKLFLPKPLDPKTKSVVSKHTETGEDVKVTFSYKKKRDLGDREVVQLYNILICRIFRILKYTQHNRNFYDASGAHVIRQHNLNIWPGYVTAVDQFEGGLLLQCDVSHRVLRTETVRDLLIGLKKRGFSDIKSEAEKALLGISVLTRYNNKSYKVDDLDWESSPKSTFKNEKGEELDYITYYKRQYGIDIQDPDQPLIVHRPKKAVSEAEVTKLICLIPELCLLTGLTDAMRSDFRVMKDVAVFTRVTPVNRQEAIKKFVKNVLTNPEANAHLLNWGLTLTTDTLPLEARQLQPEVIHFGKNYRETVNPKADWGRAATTKEVLTPVPLKKWAIFFPDKSKAIVQNFCKVMQQQGPRMGIPIANPKVVALPNDRTDTYMKALRDILDPSVQLVLTVVPQQKSDRYAALKKLCCLEKPVASQVVVLKTISNEKRLTSVAQKIVLQINCKLGGELWSCATPYKNLMVVGIDVYHEKNRKSGSIAGIVTSLNDSLSRYYSNVAIQRQGQEIVDALKVAFMEALIKYYEVNHTWPKNIVVFRDGVSDSQMDFVQQFEASQFLEAFKHLDESMTADRSSSSSDESMRKRLNDILPAEYAPGFTYIIVQKRISTRILAFQRGPGGSVGFENPPPGTVLDHTVTRYKFKDFFLVPQSVNQGTVTPTHFVVVKESSAAVLDVNDIQKLAYKLTHMYYNWPGTVRVPAPCQYAHKMVDLVGEHLHNQPSPELNNRLYFL